MSYANIHDNLNSVEIEYPTKEEMFSFLENKNIGCDFKSGKVKLPKQEKKLKDLYRATILSKNFGDVCLVNPNELPDMDLFTYSFPCQSISIAGKREGMTKGKTRSSLLYECEKIIETKRPKYLLLENVEAFASKRFKSEFDEWLRYLGSLGYSSYWAIINSKDFGIPQNRKRVFVVSILGGGDFSFDYGKISTRPLQEFLEDEVDKCYYVQPDIQERFVRSGDNAIKIPQATKEGYIEMELPGICDLTYPNSKTRRGRVQDKGACCPTLTTGKKNVCYIDVHGDKCRVRRLTPLECWRLMGCSDEDFYKAQEHNSDTQLYKQAGNSIVVPVLEGIFKQLFMK